MVLAAVLGSMEVHALDKAEVWNLYREGESSFRQANELLGTDPAEGKGRFLRKRLSVLRRSIAREESKTAGSSTTSETSTFALGIPGKPS